MTKLPKRLEKLIEQKAGEYECGKQFPERKWNENDYKFRDYQAGGTDIALEVLKEAQKLVEALSSIKCDTKEAGTAEECIDALSNWNAFVEGE